MTQYDLAEYLKAVASLLTVIADTTTDSVTKGYSRAILQYAEDLDRLWE